MAEVDKIRAAAMTFRRTTYRAAHQMSQTTEAAENGIKPKHRVFCREAQKAKILFETEKKANNFLKWNEDKIPHTNPLRSYYCGACGGWHITHLILDENKRDQTDIVLERYTTFKTNYKKQSKQLCSKK